MLADFERRLADVTGARLPSPFTGRVEVAPAVPAGNGPVVQLSVGAVELLKPDFGSVRTELTPGLDTNRRVLRLRCDVEFAVTPQSPAGRDQVVQAVDALLHLFDDSELRRATALAEPGDPGFLLDFLGIRSANLSDHLDPTVQVPVLTLEAEGWFWPIGAEGIDGPEIERALVRQVVLPVTLVSSVSQLIAGAAAADLELLLGSTGTLAVQESGVSTEPFGSLAVGLTGPGGQPGAGALGGGSDGPDGRRVLAVSDGRAVLTYTPPGAAGTDELVVSSFIIDGDGETRVGMELARFPLAVRSDS